MKKTLILSLVVAGSTLFAGEPFLLRSTTPKQEVKSAEATSSKALRKNFDGIPNIVVKMNLTQLGFKNLSFMGEYGFHKKMSVGLGFSSLLERPFPSALFATSDYFSAPSYKGFAVTPEFRFYFAGNDDKPAPQGFYIAAYMRYAKYTLTQTATYQETPSSTLYTGTGEHIYKGATGGLMIGYQWILKKGFTIDWWIVGGGAGKASYSYSWRCDQANLTAKQQADVKSQFTNYFDGVSAISSDGLTVTTTPKSATASAGGLPMVSLRFMGLCLGYAF
jgi:hypothetical protein